MNKSKLFGIITGLLLATLAILPTSAYAAAPDGAGPWADTVVTSSQGLMKNGSPVPAPRSDATSALGVAENTTVDGTFFSLGFGGSITLSFDNLISNGVIVVEATNPDYPLEQVNIELSSDGASWINAGTIVQDGSVSMPDNLTCAKFVRITDTSNAANFTDDTADAYDVDGVQATDGEPCEIPTPTQTPTPTNTPSNSGGSGGDGRSDGRSDGLSSCPSCTAAPAGGSQVLGASTGGQVLGASTDTLAATGSFVQLALAVLSGFAVFIIGAKRHEIS